MKRLALFVALLCAGSTAHADFVTTGGQTLPATKSDAKPRPATIPATQWFGAADYNALMQGEYDLRAGLVAGAYHGLSLQALDPAPRGLYPTTNYLWLKNNLQLHLNVGTDNLIPYGAVTTKGDSLWFNGLTWDRVAAGSNGWA